MNSIYMAALAIGGSTLLGTACGFLFNRVTESWSRAVSAFAAGVMLAAACFGLFNPALEMARGVAGLAQAAAGAACGAGLIRLVGRLPGRLHGAGMILGRPELLFVLAIIIHKFPEGMAGGVGLGGADPSAARTMVIAVALQNLPEGVVMIPPLLAAGMRPKRAAGVALATGILNAAGVFAGALWGYMAAGLLPFALAFAGGAMLDVILGQMIPRIADDSLQRDTLITLGGFMIMACINALC